MYTDLDFMEIGTSNFNTLIQESDDFKIGLSIEPCLEYLNQLPNKKNVKKINAAVTNIKDKDYVSFYYIPETIIDLHKLPMWFKGTNTINSYHPLHVLHNVQHLVKIEKVPLKTFEEIIVENNINHIKYLKIDTEGHDCNIMLGIFEYYKNKNINTFPSLIQFESNENSPIEKVESVIQKFISIGYKLKERGYDTILEFIQ